MANEHSLKSRIINKHDIEANWIKAGDAENPFIPKKGEIIIYDPDDNYSYARMKIGDGVTNVTALLFSDGSFGGSNVIDGGSIANDFDESKFIPLDSGRI